MRPLAQVYRGRVLRDRAALLSDVCSDGETLVLLAGRQPAAGPARGAPVPKVRN